MPDDHDAFRPRGPKELERLLTAEALTRRSLLARTGGAVAVTGIGGALLAACGGTSAKTASTQAGKTGAKKITTLRIASASNWTGLDPIAGDVIANVPAAELVCVLNAPLTLVTVPSDFAEAKAAAATGKLIGDPYLAEKWETTNNRKTWRFTLREGAGSPAGNMASTDDVLWTLARNLASPTLVSAFLYSLVGITKKNQIKAIDERVFEMNLPAPAPPFFLQLLGTYYIVTMDSVELRKHVTKKDPWAAAFLKTNSAGFGPYAVKAAVPGKSIDLKLNPNFFGDKPAFSSIRQNAVDSPGSRLQLALTGDADFTQELSALQLQQANKGKTTKASTFTSTRVSFLVMNSTVKPFGDPEVRKAMAKAIPYDTIIKNVYRGFAQQWKSAFIPWLQGSTDDYWDYATDPAAAKAGLASVAGTKVTLSYATGFGVAQQIAVIVQQALNDAGLDVTLEGLQPSIIGEKKIKGEVAFFVDDTDSPAIPSPLYTLNYLYTKTAFQNMAKYENPEVDAIAAKLALETDLAKQNDLISQANKIIMGDLPYIPIAYTGTSVVHSTALATPQGNQESLVDYTKFKRAGA